jgi:hypothetical protein
MFGAGLLLESMRNPDRLIIEKAHINYEVACYTYRAENGFGGMNREWAILIYGDDPQYFEFVGEGDSNLATLWQQRCTGNGVEAAGAANQHGFSAQKAVHAALIIFD